MKHLSGWQRQRERQGIGLDPKQKHMDDDPDAFRLYIEKRKWRKGEKRLENC